MFDIGWSELLVIGCIALIVVGPKELPRMLRTFGQYVNHMRGMAREFQRSMDEAAREADISQMKELRQAASDLRSLKTMNIDSLGKPAPKTAAAPSSPPAQPAAAGPATPPAAAPAAQPATPPSGQA